METFFSKKITILVAPGGLINLTRQTMRNMNIKYFFAGLAIAVPALLFAKPADSRVRTFTNPDGSTVQVRVHGDEYFNFMTDADCTRLLETDSRGFVVDAVRFGEVLRFNPEDVDVLRAEVEEMRLQNPDPALRRPARMAALTSEGRSQYPTIGEGNHSLVVLVEFSDVEFSMDDPQDYFHRQLNEPGFSDYGGKGSALDYYTAISNGKYLPTFDVVGPVKLSKKASYFYKNQDNPIVNMPEFVREAMTLVNENCEVDFSNYDLDGDGVLDTVFFYYAGYGSADSNTSTIWPHQADFRWYSSLHLGGKLMGPYACGNELKGWNPETGRQPWLDGSAPWVDGIGTFAHEYGHVLGLPDLYDVNYINTKSPGEWDVMDAGCYNFDGCVPPLFSAYEQWVCRWLEFEQAEDGTHYDLEALGNAPEPKAVRIRIPMNEAGTNFYTEYFVIESRDNSGWDACFPEPGLMVWRINYKKNNWTNNSVNTNGVSHVEIVYPKNEKHPLFESGAIYPGADVELKPSGKYTYWRSPYITNIVYDKETKTGSLDYNMVEPSDVATVLHDNPEAAPDGSKAFTLVWDEVEGVDEYLLTIKTVKSGKVVNNFNKTSVGKQTTVTVDGLSTMYWKLEMEAYVTCVVGGIPSTEDSNVIKFTPSELPKEGESAVGAIEASDVAISGGIGCINAPEGAEIYNPAGQRLKADGLAPGVYIVVYGNKTVKVMVR